MADNILDIMKEYVPQSHCIPIYIVTDNAANIKAAVKALPRSYVHVPCFAHTLQLCVNDSIKEFPELLSVATKGKELTTHFRHSSVATSKLCSMQLQLGLPKLKLKQECPTRCNSRYYLLERMVSGKQPLSAVLVDIPNVNNLLSSEWLLAEIYVKVLAPFEKVTTIMSGAKYPTISLVIPILNELKHSLSSIAAAAVGEENEQGVVRSLCPSLIKNIDSRLHYERTPLYVIATLLDPMYKDCAFIDD